MVKTHGLSGLVLTFLFLSTAVSIFGLGESFGLDQCANGGVGDPPEPCTGTNWVNSNVNSSRAHWFEGDSIPYRVVFEGLTIGIPNTFTFAWDTTKGGKHAIDYITSYDRTESIADGNNPCSGVPGCSASTTFPIPLDPNVSGAGVNQIGGQVFTIWGATINTVSVYTVAGSYAGDSSTRITVTFTPSTSNPVLAWGGHIARRADWGNGNTAINIAGSPYNASTVELNGAGGTQSRSLSTTAVLLSSEIRIIKQASPESAQAFGFSTTGTGLSSFALVDDGADNDATPNNIAFSNLLSPVSSGSFTVSETANGLYDLTGINCSVSPGGTSTASPNIPTSSVSITLQYGDTVTCTFINTVATASGVSISGRTVTSFGTPISRARITVTDVATGEVRSAISSSFGQYEVDGLTAGRLCFITVVHKRYVFESFVLSVDDSVKGFDLVGK